MSQLHVHTSDMIPKRYLRRLKKTIAKVSDMKRSLCAVLDPTAFLTFLFTQRRKCDPDKVHAVFAVFYIEALVVRAPRLG